MNTIKEWRRADGSVVSQAIATRGDMGTSQLPSAEDETTGANSREDDSSGAAPSASAQQSHLYARLVYFLALETCARLGEIADACWEDIDWEDKTWLISARNSKYGLGRRVLLTDGAVEAFAELRSMADPDSKRVFHRMEASAMRRLMPFRFRDAMRKLCLHYSSFHELRTAAKKQMKLRLEGRPRRELLAMIDCRWGDPDLSTPSTPPLQFGRPKWAGV